MSRAIAPYPTSLEHGYVWPRSRVAVSTAGWGRGGNVKRGGLLWRKRVPPQHFLLRRDSDLLPRRPCRRSYLRGKRWGGVRFFPLAERDCLMRFFYLFVLITESELFCTGSDIYIFFCIVIFVLKLIVW